MQEIKKILPSSLAKYLSIIASMTILLSGLLNFVFSAVQTETSVLKAYWWKELINVLVGTIVAYIVFWAIGYLFAIIYNFLALRSGGIIISVKSIDVASLKESQHEKLEDKKDNFVV